MSTFLVRVKVTRTTAYKQQSAGVGCVGRGHAAEWYRKFYGRLVAQRVAAIRRLLSGRSLAASQSSWSTTHTHRANISYYTLHISIDFTFQPHVSDVSYCIVVHRSNTPNSRDTGWWVAYCSEYDIILSDRGLTHRTLWCCRMSRRSQKRLKQTVIRVELSWVIEIIVNDIDITNNNTANIPSTESKIFAEICMTKNAVHLYGTRR